MHGYVSDYTALVLWLIAVALWALGFVLGARLPRLSVSNVRLPALRVSVIVPARNEEHNLPALLRSLQSQTFRLHEILVVDDGSTDRTAEVALSLGAQVIPSTDLPEGWRGKPWACQQGAGKATGDLLLFLDADTWFEQEGLSVILKHYEGGALSVGPYHAVRRPYEDLSLFFNLNMVLGTVPHGLFGQLLLVDRESYRRVGGHEAVKDRILENFHLAKAFRAQGTAVRGVTGQGVLAFRMYPNGLRELTEGWVKGFASGAASTPVGTLLLVVAWMVGLVLAPMGNVATGDGILWGGMYLACVVQLAWLSRQVGAFRWFSVLLYPVPLLFFFVVFAWSKARSGKEVRWKGRTIRAH